MAARSGYQFGSNHVSASIDAGEGTSVGTGISHGELSGASVGKGISIGELYGASVGTENTVGTGTSTGELSSGGLDICSIGLSSVGIG